MVEDKGTEMFMHLGQAMEMRHPFSPWLIASYFCDAQRRAACLSDDPKRQQEVNQALGPASSHQELLGIHVHCRRPEKPAGATCQAH